MAFASAVSIKLVIELPIMKPTKKIKIRVPLNFFLTVNLWLIILTNFFYYMKDLIKLSMKANPIPKSRPKMKTTRMRMIFFLPFFLTLYSMMHP